MSDALKSAFEIAMEKLRARDKERGEKSGKPLTDDKKRQIAEVRRLYASRCAEREILYRADLEKAAGDPEERQKVEDAYVTDRRRLESEQETQIRKIRGS